MLSARSRYIEYPSTLEQEEALTGWAWSRAGLAEALGQTEGACSSASASPRARQMAGMGGVTGALPGDGLL